MKKLVSLLLAVVLAFALFSLAACSGSKKGEEPPKSGEKAPSAGAEPVKIYVATGYNDTEMNGEIVKFYCDYVTEHTNGAVEFEIYFGGTFCADAEVFDYVKAGDIGLGITQPVYAMSYMPFTFSICGYDSMEGTMDILYDIFLNNKEMHDLIQEQCAEHNMYFLGYTAAGPSVILSKNEVKSWKDCAKYTIGSPINLDIYASLGCGTVAIEPPDMYDSLSRGVCDMVAYAAPNAVGQKLYEVAPHVGDMRSYFANQSIVLNLEIWNSLEPEIQTVFKEAALSTSDFSIKRCEELTNELKDIIIENGGTWNTFTDEEGKMLNAMLMKATNAMLRGFAENLGCSEGMEKIIAAWGEGLGQDFSA
ncbi:MAG: TRAP transporter substrate-binding protein [Oscillospiraceae bacterium]|jgi:TRAP-type C4-dicarboxylate transport system substrate-binding protein